MPGIAENGYHPQLGVCESDGAVTIRADLPGIEKKDLDVSFDDGVLTIKGERKSKSEETDDKTHHLLIERTYGSFERSLSLPPTIDDAAIKANFKDGVLEITAPEKPDIEKKSKTISVKSG